VSRQEVKKAEKRRWNALSPDEQKVERSNKRRATTESKARGAAIVEAVDREQDVPAGNFVLGVDWGDLYLDLFDGESAYV
jgi:hypothetical protein